MALPGFNVKKVPTVQNKLIEEIVDYLNTRAGTKYKHDAKNTVKYISARLREGYTIEDFKYVIDVKVNSIHIIMSMGMSIIIIKLKIET